MLCCRLSVVIGIWEGLQTMCRTVHEVSVYTRVLVQNDLQ